MKVMTVTGMTCSGCARKVEAALKKLSPEAIVSMDPPQVSLPNSITAAKANEALAAIGKYRYRTLYVWQVNRESWLPGSKPISHCS